MKKGCPQDLGQKGDCTTRCTKHVTMLLICAYLIFKQKSYMVAFFSKHKAVVSSEVLEVMSLNLSSPNSDLNQISHCYIKGFLLIYIFF